MTNFKALIGQRKLGTKSQPTKQEVEAAGCVCEEGCSTQTLDSSYSPTAEEQCLMNKSRAPQPRLPWEQTETAKLARVREWENVIKMSH